MRNDIFYTLVETVVGNKLKDMKEYPERAARNLIDLGLLLSNGNFQNAFFSSAQSMLQDEESPYYKLIDNVVNNVSYERLLTFGMNLGYNSFKHGSKEIRKNEKILNCIIPWNIILHIDNFSFKAHKHNYHRLISDGENLGIYSWIIFLEEPFLNILELAKEHPNSVFFVFFKDNESTQENIDDVFFKDNESIQENIDNVFFKDNESTQENIDNIFFKDNKSTQENIDDVFLDKVEELNNVMLVIALHKKNRHIYKELQNRKLLYSVYYKYSQKNVDQIIDGSILHTAEKFNPFFTIFIPEPYCNDNTRKIVYKIAEQTRNEQRYSTIAWELFYSNAYIDKIISNKTRYIAFDENGNLCRIDEKKIDSKNIFYSDLESILKSSSLN